MLVRLVLLTLFAWHCSITAAVEPASGVKRVAFVSTVSANTPTRGRAAFWARLAELGWVEGRNLVVERRYAEGHAERLPALMTEVVERKVDVIVTANTLSALAAKKATNTVPIVVFSIGDAVGSGLAESLARPGGNLTGLSLGWSEGFTGKWLELLQESVPALSTVTVIYNPASSANVRQVKELSALGMARNLNLKPIPVRGKGDLTSAFEQARRQSQAVIVLTDPITYQHQSEVASLGLRHKLPTMFGNLEFVDAGGLLAYGVDHAILLQRCAEYVDKILRGTRPGELPIEQPAKPVVAINLRTAKAIGVTVPESVLLRADEVIR